MPKVSQHHSVGIWRPRVKYEKSPLTCFTKMDSGPVTRTRVPNVGDFGVLQGNFVVDRDTSSATSWLFITTMG